MAREILFDPSEYQALSDEERAFLKLAYKKAVQTLRRNLTQYGFTPCSLADNKV